MWTQANYLTSKGQESFNTGSYGQMTSRIEAAVTTTYAYNPMRMMKEASEAGVTLAKYEYDALGRRIISWFDDEWRTVSLWSGNDSIYKIRQEWTTPPPNPPTETITRYVAVNGQYLVKLVGGYNSTQKYFHHTDIVGTVRAVTDIYGAVVARYAYEPFGSLTTASGLVDGELHRFTGKPSDLETSLSYFNARYYDPAIGRFTSSDPARDGLNWFVYCNGNPLIFKDNDGQKEVKANSITGNLAHYAISWYMEAMIRTHSPSADVIIERRFESMRCDIYASHDGVREVWEVKPISYYENDRLKNKGMAQLGKYVGALSFIENIAVEPGRTLELDGKEVMFPVYGGKGKIILHTYADAPGMVYYSLDDMQPEGNKYSPVTYKEGIAIINSILLLILSRRYGPMNTKLAF